MICSRDSRETVRKDWPSSASSSIATPAMCSGGSSDSIASMAASAPMSVAARAQKPCGSGWWSSDGTNVSTTARRTARWSSVNGIPISSKSGQAEYCEAGRPPLHGGCGIPIAKPCTSRTPSARTADNSASVSTPSATTRLPVRAA